MNDLQSSIGIVLQAIPYRDYDKILTLFTPHQGLLKLFVKGSYKTHLIQHPYTTPLAKGEYFYRLGKKLPMLEEGKLLTSHLDLRNSLESLESAVQCAQALLGSQSQGKAAPQLFALFAAYLESLPKAPKTLLTSFFLKVLNYEGLLQNSSFCHHCQLPLAETWRLGGECFCQNHAPQNAHIFSQEEEKSLRFLTLGRSLSEICEFSFENDFAKKIASLFEEALKH